MASASSSVGNVVNIAILEDDPLIQQRFSKILHSWPRLGELTSFSNNYALAEFAKQVSGLQPLQLKRAANRAHTGEEF